MHVGYPKETRGYYVYCPSDNKVFVVRHGSFLERDFFSKRNSGSKIELEEVHVPQDTSEAQMETGEEPQDVVEAPPVTQEPRRSDRTRFQPERYGFLVTENKDVLLMERGEPTTYQEAVVDPNSEKWVEPLKAEMQSMYDNEVWTLVAPPEGVKPVGCKWVFKEKTDMDGNVNVFKARLVAKGVYSTSWY